MAAPFADRRAAGRALGQKLTHLQSDDVVVVGLPRGGVPVAYEVAEALGAPLDVILVRKLGVPYQPELAMGAIGEDGVRFLDARLVRLTHVTEDELARVEARERLELDRRVQQYRHTTPRLPLAGKTALIVDDGLATGSTARAAIEVARLHGASRVVLAVPLAPVETVESLREVADDVVALATPEPFLAVGNGYRDFRQVGDDEVTALLRAAASHAGPHTSDAPTETSGPGRSRTVDDEVLIESDGVRLPGHLTVPDPCAGLVVFAHGSGSSRHSPRNQAVAEALNRAGLGTLLLDLLTDEEAADRYNVFDIDLLARRLAGASAALGRLDATRDLPLGYFGASTGAAAALVAAARHDGHIGAIVSRGGRPDLAGAALAEVDAPTLLIVGGADDIVVDLNRRAARQLRAAHRIEIVPGATHLFEEPGALERVADLARDWFLEHLTPG